jgi:hypothetical protein
VRQKVLLIVGIILAIIIIASFINSYWETIPYARYKTGEEIVGFPYGSTSMTVNGFTTAQDITFPESSISIFVNVTIHKLGINQNQSEFPEPSNKFLVLSYGTSKEHGETSAWNGFNDSLGIATPDNEISSLAANQSVDGSIRFVLGNGNYTSFQLICRAYSQQKPLFIVELQNT